MLLPEGCVYESSGFLADVFGNRSAGAILGVSIHEKDGTKRCI